MMTQAPEIKYCHFEHYTSSKKKGDATRSVDNNGPGLACVAYTIDPLSYMVTLGIAFCHPVDQYIKSIGRTKAVEAYKEEPITLSFEGLYMVFMQARSEFCSVSEVWNASDHMLKAMVINGLGMYVEGDTLLNHEYAALESISFSKLREVLRYEIIRINDKLKKDEERIQEDE